MDLCIRHSAFCFWIFLFFDLSVVVPGDVPFYTRSSFPSPLISWHLVKMVNSNHYFPVTLRPPVGWVSCGADDSSRTVSSSTRSASSPGSRDLVKNHQLRSQRGLHQSPSTSLLTCAGLSCSGDALTTLPGRAIQSVISRTEPMPKSPSMMCSPHHHAPQCHHVTWAESCPALAWHPSCQSEALN